MKTRLVKILSLILIASVIVPLSAASAPPEPPDITVLSSEPEITAASGQKSLDLDAAVHTAEGRVRLIVELQAAPLGLAVLPEKSKSDLESPASQAYLTEVTRQQKAVLSEMTALAPSLQVDFRYTMAFNGFGIRVDPAEALALLKLDSIKRIYPDRMRTLTLDASLDVLNAPAFWTDLGGVEHAGDGIRIAVIDTGIRSEHPMFAGDGFTQPPGFPHGYCADHPTDFYFQCNDKLIAARYYEPTFAIHGAEVLKPLDIHGHGSHVAGIAAGNPVEVAPGAVVPDTTSISGVAPRAYLMVYKAFFTKSDETAGSSDSMLLAALNDALLDGADVVNNSWGGVDIEDPADNPYSTAIKALKATGAVVVFAAGNGGPGAGTIHCPGCLEDVITVGATTADRVFANTIDVTGPGAVPPDLLGMAALAGSGPEILEAVEARVLSAGMVDPLNATACSSFAGEVFSDTIALISRGDCPFLDKVTHVQNAGARAAVVVNDEPGFPIPMANLESTLIPAVFMSQDQGQALLDWVTGTVSPTALIHPAVTAVYNDNWQDMLWESSATGPNADPNILKPDIVAPGVNILSAISPVFTGNESYLFLQGTSMAAAHVSGAAALIRQQHADWTPQQIKTALTSTAIQQVYQPDGSTLATPFMIGSGRLDLGRARSAGVTFSHSSFVNNNCSLQCGWSGGVITNMSLTTSWWDAHVSAPAGMNVQVTPAYAISDAGESVPFSISVDVSGLPSDQWYFASVAWEDKFGTSPDAYLPIAVYVTDPVQARLDKGVNRRYASPGDTVTYSLILVNEAPLTTTFTITDPIPNNASYVPGSSSGGLVYDGILEELRVTDDLAGAQMQVVTDTLYGAYYSLPDLGVGPVACPDTSCDDAALLVSGLDFYFNGRPASEVVWSTNGYLQVSSFIANLSTPNQNFPDTVVPNNLIAPLWTDLDLDGGGGDGSGHGALYYALIQVGVEPDAIVYYVFEWKEAEAKGAPWSQYSFQVWIERGTGNIWFVYGPQTTAISTGTVGIENLYGSVGSTYFFNGSGTAPIAGTTLKASATLDSAGYSYSLEIGPDKSIDVINIAQAENQLTGQLFQATRKVSVGDYMFFPLVQR